MPVPRPSPLATVRPVSVWGGRGIKREKNLESAGEDVVEEDKICICLVLVLLLLLLHLCLLQQRQPAADSRQPRGRIVFERQADPPAADVVASAAESKCGDGSALSGWRLAGRHALINSCQRGFTMDKLYTRTSSNQCRETVESVARLLAPVCLCPRVSGSARDS